MQWHKSSDISQIVISLVLRTRAITCDMPLLAIALPYNIYTLSTILLFNIKIALFPGFAKSRSRTDSLSFAIIRYQKMHLLAYF